MMNTSPEKAALTIKIKKIKKSFKKVLTTSSKHDNIHIVVAQDKRSTKQAERLKEA